MRKLSSTALLLLLSLPFPAFGANELLNPSFEVEDPDGGMAPADWTSVGDYLTRSDDVAHTGDWSMMIDNEQPNSFGQWKQIRPAQWEYDVEPEDELHQSLWLYIDEAEEPPIGTEVHLLTRWNGLVPQANDVGFTLIDYPLNEWFQIETEMFAPEFDADGEDVTFATTTFYVNTNNDPEDLGGVIYYDDASWGLIGDDPSVAGDFNGNGSRDVDDLDLLTTAMAANDVSLDLNGDNVTNINDRIFWIEQLANSYMGDSNFDGEFSSADFVAVFTTAKYETGEAATWAEGDWNGDGVFSSSDFVAAFSGAGYEQGAREGGLQTVPEPSAIVLAFLAVAMMLGRRRIR